MRGSGRCGVQAGNTGTAAALKGLSVYLARAATADLYHEPHTSLTSTLYNSGSARCARCCRPAALPSIARHSHRVQVQVRTPEERTSKELQRENNKRTKDKRN